MNTPTTKVSSPEDHISDRSKIGVVCLRILQKCGIDRAIAYTLAGRSWSVLATPVTWLLIGRYLLPAQQGFYYTFGSVIAMNVLLELGLTGVIVQFASHEKAHLEWVASDHLSGSENAYGRLGELLRLSMRWYGAASALILLLLMPLGIAFFSRTPVSFQWRTPWVILTSTAAINLLIAPLLAILEGCGKVAHIASLRMTQNVFASLGLWLTLLMHGNLYASPVFETIDVTVAIVWVAWKYRRFFRNLLSHEGSNFLFSWRSEVWPFQWRIAITSMGGYLISQLFNPVLFATRGPVVAGQMGMSLSVASGLVVISYAWISTKASPFGVLVATRQWLQLDALFFRTLWQSVLVLIAFAATAFAGLLALPLIAPSLAPRLLTPLPFGILLIAAVMNHVIYSEALYLRAHKAEPFLVVSIGTGAITALTTAAVARPFGALGVCISYLVCTIMAVILSTMIFLKKRKEWHHDGEYGAN